MSKRSAQLLLRHKLKVPPPPNKHKGDERMRAAIEHREQLTVFASNLSCVCVYAKGALATTTWITNCCALLCVQAAG